MRFRLRTALIAIAVLSLPMAGVAVVARHGGLGAFQRHHAGMYNGYSFQAARSCHAASTYRGHMAPGHSCPRCRRYTRPIPVLIAEAQQRQRNFERKARWHGFLACPMWWRRGARIGFSLR